MKKFAMFGLLLSTVAGGTTVVFAQVCPNGNGQTVQTVLEWCSRNSSGFNEGATCGLSKLSGLGIGGLPAMAAQPVLGNTWSRTNMMGAAKFAAKNGQIEPAVDAAICCQVHTPWAQACLANNRAAVAVWLRQ